jgi:hypothetical protein
MKIPGFTAEAALCEKQDSYASTRKYAEESGMVRPQNVCWVCTPDGCFPRPCIIRPHV